MAKIEYSVQRLDVDNLTLSSRDSELIESFKINSSFDLNSFKIELHIFSLDSRLLKSNSDFRGYGVEKQTPGTTFVDTVKLNPAIDVENEGYSNGDVRAKYNFLNDLYTEDLTRSEFYIDLISQDRTEVRAKNLNIDSAKLQEYTDGVLDKLFNDNFIGEILGNFKQDRLFRIINVRQEGDFLYLKFYEPLPLPIGVKSTFYVDEEVADSEIFEINSLFSEDPVEIPFLKGPNFNIEIQSEVSNPTEYFSIQDLLPSITGSNHRVYSRFNELGVELGIDYTSFNNFVHFSSAQERLDNFKYKLGLIETYQSSSNVVNNSTTADSEKTASLTYYSNLEKGIVNNFDHYERFLYYESGSFSWPKVSSNYPYVNAATTSSAGINFYNLTSLSASLYDQTNKDRLTYTIPEFISDDTSNSQYLLFIDMIGHHFDNLWIYSRAVTDKYNADNRLDRGISKDIVGEALRNFGIKLYSSNSSLDTLFAMYAGEIPNTGSEVINTFISASDIPTSKDDYNKEVLKRIYHNLPLLLKSKGTERGLRALINTFGIPNEIGPYSSSLEIRYYGGINSDTLPFYGPFRSYSSSLDRIRLDNTGSITSGNTLALNTAIEQREVKFTQDLHTLEVGFSPTTFIDNKLTASLSSTFNIDNYIGDPRQYTSSYYPDLTKISTPIFNSIDRYNIKDFVRQVKFFNNSLFRMIYDFVPARTNVNTGIIIKPNILNRSKVKQPFMSYSRPEYTGSLSIGTITGSNAGAFKTVTTADEEYSTSYTFTRKYSTGTSSVTVVNGLNKIDGEFSGSILKASTGELNSSNSIKVGTCSTFSVNSDYDVTAGCIQNTTRSNILLRLDREEDSIKPKNSDFLTGSFVDGYRNTVNSSSFALFNDSNLGLESWNRIRYKGSKNTYDSTRAYFPILKLEPFEGAIYSLSALSGSIQNVVDTTRRTKRLYFGGDPALLATEGSLSDSYVEVTTSISGTTTTVTATYRDYEGLPITTGVGETITVTYRTRSTGGPGGETTKIRYVTIASESSSGTDSFTNKTLAI